MSKVRNWPREMAEVVFVDDHEQLRIGFYKRGLFYFGDFNAERMSFEVVRSWCYINDVKKFVTEKNNEY